MPDNYEAMRAEAQSLANKEGWDFIMLRDYFGNYSYRRLPGEGNRYGHELTCEVVRPENNKTPYEGYRK